MLYSPHCISKLRRALFSSWKFCTVTFFRHVVCKNVQISSLVSKLRINYLIYYLISRNDFYSVKTSWKLHDKSSKFSVFFFPLPSSAIARRTTTSFDGLATTAEHDSYDYNFPFDDDKGGRVRHVARYTPSQTLVTSMTICSVHLLLFSGARRKERKFGKKIL